MKEMASMSVMTRNCLLRAGIIKTEDIAAMTIPELVKVRSLGRKSLEEVLTFMQGQGYRIEDDRFVKDEDCGPDYCEL